MLNEFCTLTGISDKERSGLQQVLEDPDAYVVSFAERLDSRNITTVIEEIREIALSDALEASGVGLIVDWKFEGIGNISALADLCRWRLGIGSINPHLVSHGLPRSLRIVRKESRQACRGLETGPLASENEKNPPLMSSQSAQPSSSAAPKMSSRAVPPLPRLPAGLPGVSY